MLYAQGYTQVSRKWKGFSLKSKLFTLIISCFVVPFLILGTIWSQYSMRSIEQYAINANQKLIEQVSGRFEALFEDLDRSTSSLITHPLVTSFLSGDEQDQYEQYVIVERIRSELLRNVTFNRPEAYRFSLLSANEKSISTSGNSPVQMTFDSILQQMNKEHIKVLGISTNEAVPLLGYARKIYDPTSTKVKGLLYIELNLSLIMQFISNFKLGANGFIWIVNAQGVIVFHADEERIGQRLPALLQNKLYNEPQGYFYENIEGEKKLFIHQPSEKTEWTLVAELPYRELIGWLGTLWKVTVAIVAILAIAAMAALGWFTYSLTRSLVQLQKLMKLAELGNLSVVSAINPHHHEIASLNVSFNNMVSELKQLIEIKHQAELREKDYQILKRDSMVKMLQAQINPHFLYNTLEVIHAHAIIAGAKPITQMIQALARIFRYNANLSKSVVTLHEEIENVKTYFLIYKERSPDFHWEILCEGSDLRHVQAIPLMVQPLVENALKHGYMANKLKPTYLSIEGIADHDCYLLRITDKGKGMPEEKMREYNAAFASAEDDQELEITAIGLWNVHRRLFYTFGRSYGLCIASSGRNGTVIEIRLPYKEEYEHVQSVDR